MATVTRENIGTLHDKIVVKISKDEYYPAFDRNIKQYAKKANVPGFRKGMVPMGVVRNMVGAQMFREEIMRVSGTHLESFLKKERAMIFGQPMLMPDQSTPNPDFRQPGDIIFAFEIGLRPEFSIPAVEQHWAVPVYKISVTEKLVDDELERLVRRSGTVESKEIVEGHENIIYATYEECDADGNVLTDTAKLEDTEVLDKMPEKLKKTLFHQKVGYTAVVCPAEICSEDELAAFMKMPLKTTVEDKDKHYLFTITKIGLLTPMEMGFEFYDKIFPNEGITTEDQFRDRLKSELVNEFTRLSYERMQNEIYELLVHNTPITLPVTFLKRWMKEGGEKHRTDEEVESEYGSFEHQLRWQLITDKITHDNKLRVYREDVLNNIKESVLRHYGMEADEDVEWLTAYMDKVDKDDKVMNETYQRMMTSLIFAELMKSLSIKEAEVDEDTFFKLPSPHATHHHHHDHEHHDHGGHDHEHHHEHEHA